MSDFDGRPLAIGSVRGVRSFDVDEFGRLTGINYPAPWSPEENTASCYLGSYDPYWSATRALGASSAYHRKLVAEHKPRHSFGSCICGFYAYYDGSNDYKTDARISAVVEGYGEVLIGSRGFRAQKARILALCIPGPDEQLRQKVSFVGKIAARGAVGGAAGETGLAAVLRYIGGDPVLGTWLMALGVLAFWASFYMPIQWPARGKSTNRLASKQVALIRRNYPNVPVFRSFKAMVAAFPPDRGLEPSPETDPNFWEVRS